MAALSEAMSTDCYRTYFDASTRGPTWWFPAVGLAFVVIGIVMFGLIRAKGGLYWPFPTYGRFTARYYRWFSTLWLGFAILWTILASVGVFGDYIATWLDERQGHLAVVEGPVENFHPMPASGHDLESFTVSGVYFAYSDYVVTAGFNQTSSHGGPIREGLLVRISYRGPTTDEEIVKLEIACSQPAGPSIGSLNAATVQ
jgi:hypothetical protein